MENLRSAYVAAQRQEKVEIARRVVELVHSNGGRFVKFNNSPNEEVYVEIGLERAVEKACQALREGCGKQKHEVRKIKRQTEKSQVGRGDTRRSSGTKVKDESMTKEPKKKRKGEPKQSLMNKGRNKSSLWQFPDYHGCGGNESRSHGSFEEHSFVHNTDSDSMEGGTDDEYPVAPRYYNRYQQTCSRGTGEHKSNVPSHQPPTHRLMVTDASLPSRTDQSEVLGWFCDYMNGDSSGESGNASLDWETFFISLVEWKEFHG